MNIVYNSFVDGRNSLIRFLTILPSLKFVKLPFAFKKSREILLDIARHWWVIHGFILKKKKKISLQCLLLSSAMICVHEMLYCPLLISLVALYNAALRLCRLLLMFIMTFSLIVVFLVLDLLPFSSIPLPLLSPAFFSSSYSASSSVSPLFLLLFLSFIMYLPPLFFACFHGRTCIPGWKT